MKQIHIKLGDDLHKKLRMFAAMSPMTIQDAVITLLNDRLNDRLAGAQEVFNCQKCGIRFPPDYPAFSFQRFCPPCQRKYDEDREAQDEPG